MPQLRSSARYGNLAGGPLHLRTQPDDAGNVPSQVAGTAMSKKWPRNIVPPVAPYVITNQGNLCYQISVNHALLHIPYFLNFLNLGHERCVVADCPLCALIDLGFAYWGGPTQGQGTVNAISQEFDRRYRIWVSLPATNATWWDLGFNQIAAAQDPVDYLESLMYIIRPPQPNHPLWPTVHLNHGTANMVVALDALFDVKVQTERKHSCRCNAGTVTDASHILRVPMVDQAAAIAPGGSLELIDLIRDEYSGNKKNLPSQCPVHNVPGHTTTEKSRIASAPLILPIQLLRLDPQGYVRNPVRYPRILKLNRYRAQGLQTRLHYELRAVVCRVSPASDREPDNNEDNEGGHFITYAYSPDGEVTGHNDTLGVRLHERQSNRILEPHTPWGAADPYVQPGRRLANGRRSAPMRSQIVDVPQFRGDAYILFYSRM